MADFRLLLKKLIIIICIFNAICSILAVSSKVSTQLSWWYNLSSMMSVVVVFVVLGGCVYSAVFDQIQSLRLVSFVLAGFAFGAIWNDLMNFHLVTLLAVLCYGQVQNLSSMEDGGFSTDGHRGGGDFEPIDA